MDIMSDQGKEYPSDPIKPTERGKSRAETEQEFTRIFLAGDVLQRADHNGMVLSNVEFVDSGHPARQVFTPEGTFLITVKWLGPQTLLS